MLRRSWPLSIVVVLTLFAPGCMGLWYAERRLAPAPDQATAPGTPVVRWNGHEAMVLLEHDTSVVRLVEDAGVTISARLVWARDCTLIGWGPFCLPALPCWLLSVPATLLDHEDGEVLAILELVDATDWSPVLSAEAGDLVLSRGGRDITPVRVTMTADRIEAAFRVRDPVGPWTLRVRHLRVGLEELRDLGPAHFEPDLALSFWIFP
jgi:hypothetical protein